MNTLALAFRQARRELRSGLSGFRIFFACLVLGVAAVAGVGSIAATFLTGLAEQGRVLLGGDISVKLVHRPMTNAERTFTASYGAVSQTVSMRAMAYALRNGREAERGLVELKAVDAAYPLYGKVGLVPAIDVHSALACARSQRPSICGAVVEQTLLDRLGLEREHTALIGHLPPPPHLPRLDAGVARHLPRERAGEERTARAIHFPPPLAGEVPVPAQAGKRAEGGRHTGHADNSIGTNFASEPGNTMRIGAQTFRIAAVLTNEPDRLSGGFSLGPHVIVSDEALARTGLVTPGSLIDYRTRIRLPATASIARFKQDAAARFPDAGWQIRDRSDAAPDIRRLIEQATMFLTLVGLTALAVAGVGAGNAAAAFLDRKRAEIAIFKTLGAEGGLIFLIFFLQVMAIAVLAAVAGIVLGAALPYVVEWIFGTRLPAPAQVGIYPASLLLALAFGLLSAAAFAIPPLARAREIAPANLFRDEVAPVRARGRWPYLGAAAGAGAAVIALALAISPTPRFAMWFLIGTAGALIALRLVAEGLRLLLRRLPHPARAAPRLALANLTRPGSAATAVIVALGLGLSLLAAVTLLNATVSAQVNGSLPGTAPTFFFIDIQPGETAAFDRTIARFASVRDYRRSPMIRGRIVALNGVPAKDAKVAGDSRWALNGDRGITYAATPPKGTDIVAGRWWPADYKGPTLISFDADLARGMGLRVGDSLTLNVLGREIAGRIANLRDVDFANGRQNFILVLSPGMIDKAPHSFLASVSVAPREEAALYRAVTDEFHGVSTVRVKDAIAQLDDLLNELSAGMRAASLVTILAGLLVLAGAIAAGQRARLYDSTVMKVLGATRWQIVSVTAMEYGVLGALTGILALAAGSAAAWFVARHVFDVPLAFDLSAVLLTVVGGAAATLAFGLLAGFSALAARPAERLRNP